MDNSKLPRSNLIQNYQKKKIEQNNFPSDTERTSQRFVHRTEHNCKLLF